MASTLPHDCRAGICGACRVRLVDGRVFGGQTQGDDMIHACQARIVSDLEIVIEAVARADHHVGARGRHRSASRPTCVGVDVEAAEIAAVPSRSVSASCSFRGFPARSYSPTYPLEGRPARSRCCTFTFERFPTALVSSALGRDIRAGHRVKLTGPFGRAFFRPSHPGRIVLVASGTGFAPMWSVAVAAIMEQPRARTGVRGRGAEHPVAVHARRAVPAGAVSQRHADSDWYRSRRKISHAVRSGRPTDHLPRLSPDDVVYTAGAPAMTDAVARIARPRARCCCHRSLRAGAQGPRTGAA